MRRNINHHPALIAYTNACKAMRAANYNPRVSDAEYSALVDTRERAFEALQAARIWGQS